ncbi:DUF6458 family protein [Kribbella sp. NPDC050241]|uniref:DUF6458 family protein n=1 Tax=Kribbella sp. NPDC050241 TaxID=3364115 RepID=UPI0037927496
MGIGVSVFLLAVGGVLAFAVSDRLSGVDLTVVGYVLMARRSDRPGGRSRAGEPAQQNDPHDRPGAPRPPRLLMRLGVRRTPMARSWRPSPQFWPHSTDRAMGAWGTRVLFIHA